jgi:hypothetical protein
MNSYTHRNKPARRSRSRNYSRMSDTTEPNTLAKERDLVRPKSSGRSGYLTAPPARSATPLAVPPVEQTELGCNM